MKDSATQALYDELFRFLPASTGADRRQWAKRIVDESIDVKALLGLVLADKPVATRFLWLLSDVGISAPETLYALIPVLFTYRNKASVAIDYSLAKYWRRVGIPPENEAEAIDILFNLVVSPTVDVHIKTNALLALNAVLPKYPELANELHLCIDDQWDKNPISFRQTAKKILLNIKATPLPDTAT